MPDKGASGGSTFAPSMMVTHPKATDAVATMGRSHPQANANGATNSGLGSSSGTTSGKGKECAVPIAACSPIPAVIATTVSIVALLLPPVQESGHT